MINRIFILSAFLLLMLQNKSQSAMNTLANAVSSQAIGAISGVGLYLAVNTIFNYQSTHDEELQKLNNELKQKKPESNIEKLKNTIKEKNDVYALKKQNVMNNLNLLCLVYDFPITTQSVLVSSVLSPFILFKNEYIKKIPQCVIAWPIMLSTYLVNNIFTIQEEKEHHQNIITTCIFTSVLINFLYLKLLYYFVFSFSGATKTRPVSWFLNKLPWWMKFSITDHLGEKANRKIVELYNKYQKNKSKNVQ